MATTSNSAERWSDTIAESVAAANEHLIARHLLFSLSILLFYFLLNRPEIILVSQLGFTAWFPATGLILAVMLCISPRYWPLLARPSTINPGFRGAKRLALSLRQAPTREPLTFFAVP
jgi:hypothetical protein